MADARQPQGQSFWQRFKEAQKQQPSVGVEMRALFREGREDLLTVLMGPLAGTTREPGAPGTPTPQQTTEALEGKEVNLRRDRIEPGQTISRADMHAYAQARAQEAYDRMGQGHQHDHQGPEM